MIRRVLGSLLLAAALAAAIDASMAPAEVYPAYEAMTFPVAPYQLALPAAALVAAPSR